MRNATGYVEIPGSMVCERAASVVAQMQWERAVYVRGVARKAHRELNKPTLLDRLLRRTRERYTLEEVARAIEQGCMSWMDPSFDDWFAISMHDDQHQCVYSMCDAAMQYPERLQLVPTDEANLFAQLWDRYNDRVKSTSLQADK